MTPLYLCSLALCIVIFICSWVQNTALTIPGFSEDQIFVAEFDVKPGGQTLSFEKQWDDVTCKFTYISQGGTKENWAMMMTTDKDKSHTLCTVMRPEGVSYLMFQTFKLEMLGNFAAMEGEVLSSSGEKLDAGQYKIDETSISEMAGKFGNSLGKVSLYGNMGKTEL